MRSVLVAMVAVALLVYVVMTVWHWRRSRRPGLPPYPSTPDESVTEATRRALAEQLHHRRSGHGNGRH